MPRGISSPTEISGCKVWLKASAGVTTVDAAVTSQDLTTWARTPAGVTPTSTTVKQSNGTVGGQLMYQTAGIQPNHFVTFVVSIKQIGGARTVARITDNAAIQAFVDTSDGSTGSNAGCTVSVGALDGAGRRAVTVTSTVGCNTAICVGVISAKGTVAEAGDNTSEIEFTSISVTQRNVASWADVGTGLGATPVQATAANRPYYGIDSAGRPYVLGDGVNDLLQCAIAGLAQPESIILVAQYMAAYTTPDRLYDGKTVNTGSIYRPVTGYIYTYAGVALARPIASTTVLQVLEADYDSTRSSIRANGTMLLGALGDAGASNMDGLTLFSNGTPAQWGNAIIYEWIYFDHVLTSAERKLVNDYLGRKYGLATGGVESRVASTRTSGSGSDRDWSPKRLGSAVRAWLLAEKGVTTVDAAVTSQNLTTWSKNPAGLTVTSTTVREANGGAATAQMVYVAAGLNTNHFTTYQCLAKSIAGPHTVCWLGDNNAVVGYADLSDGSTGSNTGCTVTVGAPDGAGRRLISVTSTVGLGQGYICLGVCAVKGTRSLVGDNTSEIEFTSISVTQQNVSNWADQNGSNACAVASPNDISTGSWSRTGSGATTANQFVEDGGNSSHRFYQVISGLVVGRPTTVVIDVQAEGRDYLRVDDGTNYATVKLSTHSQFANSGMTLESAVPVGGSIYRYTFSAAAVAATTVSFYASSDGTTLSYVGNSAAAFDVWNVKVEQRIGTSCVAIVPRDWTNVGWTKTNCTATDSRRITLAASGGNASYSVGWTVTGVVPGANAGRSVTHLCRFKMSGTIDHIEFYDGTALATLNINDGTVHGQLSCTATALGIDDAGFYNYRIDVPASGVSARFFACNPGAYLDSWTSGAGGQIWDGEWISFSQPAVEAQATAASRPQYTYDASGRRVVWADGVDDTMLMALGGGSQPEEILTVAYWDGAWASGTQTMFDGKTDSTGTAYRYGATSISEMAGTNLPTTTSPALTVSHAWDFLFNGASSAMRADGTIIAGPGNTGAAVMDGLSLFSRSVPTGWSKMYMYEFVDAQKALADTERWSWDDYAGKKYGLSRLLYDTPKKISGLVCWLRADYVTTVDASLASMSDLSTGSWSVTPAGLGHTTDTLTDTVDGAPTSHAAYQASPTNVRTGYSLNVRVKYKAGTKGWGAVSFGNAYAYLNGTTGAIGTTSLCTATTPADAGGGWWRTTLTLTPSSGVVFDLYITSVDGSVSYQGDGTGTFKFVVESFTQQAVSTWTDETGRSVGPVQATAGSRPAWFPADANYGGRPVVQFTGTSFMQSVAWAVAQAQPSTIYIVGESPTDKTSARFLMDGIAVGHRNAIAATITDGYPQVYSGTANVGAAAPTVSATKSVMCAVLDATDVFYTNSYTTPIGTGNSGSNDLTGITLGVGYDGATGPLAGGKIAEVLVFSGAHTLGQRRYIMQYLATLYSITLT